jgi:micrococcal nuclease
MSETTITEFNPYIYNAKIISVYDGDTVTALVDCGFNITVEMKLRLLGINTPELRGDEREQGLISRDYVRDMILDKDVLLETYKDKTGKYGRMLATIHFNGINVNEHLITEGYAKPY